MEIKSDYSISKLFVDKTVRISADNQIINLKLRTLRDFYEDRDWNAFYHIISMSEVSLGQTLKLKEEVLKEKSHYEIIKILIFDLGQFNQFKKIYTIFLDQFNKLFDKFELKNGEFVIDDVTITNDIWEYIIYLLKLSYGEKIEKPVIFSSEEARKFYLAQKANEEKIKKIRSSKEGEGSEIMKILLSIIYKFPSITIDYLFDQTMAQIIWLRKYAAGAVSYEVNAQAFAAGNVKKGKKLDFFIK